GQERMRGNLSIKFGGPFAGDGCATERAAAFGTEAVIFHQIAIAFDQGLAAIVAVRIFKIADHAWNVAGIDVAESCSFPNFCRTQQIFGAGVFRTVGRGVAIRDKAGDESGRSGFLEYRNRPLTCDERFVVGTDEYFAALGKRVAYQRFWAGLERR